MTGDLFSAAVEERLRPRAPLAARLRPRTLDEVVGQEHLLGAGPAAAHADRGRPALVGRALGTAGHRQDDDRPPRRRRDREGVRAAVGGERRREGRARGRRARPAPASASRARARSCSSTRCTASAARSRTRCSRTSRRGCFVLIGATTENPFFSLTGPLLSRSTLFRLEPLDADGAAHAARARDSTDPRGLARRGLTLDDDALGAPRRPRRGRRPPRAHLARGRDRARPPKSGRDAITLGDAEAALALRALRYGDDEHYDVLSAFIKSIRGSDVDAGLYWLARMLEAGEDARLIARRLVILASEDVGPRRLAGPRRRRRRGTRRRVRRAARGAAEPRARGRVPGARAEVELGDDRARCGSGRRAGSAGGPGPSASAGLSLSWRGGPRPWRGVSVPARRARGLGGPGAPTRRGGRPSVLAPDRPRGRRRGQRSRRRRARSGRRSRKHRQVAWTGCPPAPPTSSAARSWTSSRHAATRSCRRRA